MANELKKPELNFEANEFVPVMGVAKKKPKEHRTGPRKRRAKKKSQNPQEQAEDVEDDDDIDIPTQLNLNTGFNMPNNSNVPLSALQILSQVQMAPTERVVTSHHHDHHQRVASAGTYSSVLSLFEDWDKRQTSPNQSSPNFGIFPPSPGRQISPIILPSNNTTEMLPAPLSDDPYQLNPDERKRWLDWVSRAVETERNRKMDVLAEIDRENNNERIRRQAWAKEAAETERRLRITQQFLNTLPATSWFEQVTSIFSNEYDVLCPYHQLGCLHICKRKDLEGHLKSCVFAGEDVDCLNETKAMHGQHGTDSYEVVCPNAVLGCCYSCPRNKLAEHLSGCPFSGISAREELLQRKSTQQNVSVIVEEERARLVADMESQTSSMVESPRASASRVNRDNTTPSSSSSQAKTTKFRKGNHIILLQQNQIQQLLESQMSAAMNVLHDDIIEFSSNWDFIRSRRELIERDMISRFCDITRALYPFCSVECFGSYSTGLNSTESDIDLVVCFPDDYYMTLIRRWGSLPLLQQLGEHLRQYPWIEIDKVLVNAKIPVIKLFALIPITTDSSSSVVAGMEGSMGLFHQRYEKMNENDKLREVWKSWLKETIIGQGIRFVVRIPVDITIASAIHSGLATTSFVRTISSYLPPLVHLVRIVKHMLKYHNLNDAFTGGLPSYAIVILCSLVLFRRMRMMMMNQQAALTSFDLTQQPDLDDSADGDDLSGYVAISRSQSFTQMYHNNDSLIDDDGLGGSIIKNSSSIHPPDPPPLPSSHLHHPLSNTYLWMKQQASIGENVALELISVAVNLLNLNNDAFNNNSNTQVTSHQASISSDTPMPMTPRRNSRLILGLPFMKRLSPVITDNVKPVLGQLFVDFLLLLGNDFIQGVHGFSIREGGFRFNVTDDPPHPQSSDPLVVEDPLNVINNVGRSTFRITAVSSLLEDAYSRLTAHAIRFNSFPSEQAGSGTPEPFSPLETPHGSKQAFKKGELLRHVCKLDK